MLSKRNRAHTELLLHESNTNKVLHLKIKVEPLKFWMQVRTIIYIISLFLIIKITVSFDQRASSSSQLQQLTELFWLSLLILINSFWTKSYLSVCLAYYDTTAEMGFGAPGASRATRPSRSPRFGFKKMYECMVRPTFQRRCRCWCTPRPRLRVPPSGGGSPGWT